MSSPQQPGFFFAGVDWGLQGLALMMSLWKKLKVFFKDLYIKVKCFHFSLKYIYFIFAHSPRIIVPHVFPVLES